MSDSEAAYNKALGQKVKTCREASGLTQQRLASGLGLTRSSVANIEAGRQALSAFALTQVVELLGVEAPGVAISNAPLREELAAKTAEVARLRGHLRSIKEFTAKIALSACPE